MSGAPVLLWQNELMLAKQPNECQSLEEIRREIHHIDRELIRGLAERKKYVLAAAKFKTSSAESDSS